MINANVMPPCISVDNKNIKVVKGDSGAVFTPYVDEASNLSWTNNGGLENPPVRNIRGANGDASVTAITNLEIEAMMED